MARGRIPHPVRRRASARIAQIVATSAILLSLVVGHCIGLLHSCGHGQAISPVRGLTSCDASRCCRGQCRAPFAVRCTPSAGKAVIREMGPQGKADPHDEGACLVCYWLHSFQSSVVAEIPLGVALGPELRAGWFSEPVLANSPPTLRFPRSPPVGLS